MSNLPLSKGQAYHRLPNGDFVPVNPPAESVAPIPQEELPPDLRSSSAEPPVMQTSTTPVTEPEPKSEPENILEQIQEKIKEIKEKPASSVKPTDEDRVVFLKALLADKPFRKIYSMLGGKLKVEFKTPTTAETEAVNEAIVIQSSRVPFGSLMAMSAAHLKHTMACCIIELTTEKEDGIVVRQFESPLTKYSDAPRKDTYYIKENDQLALKSGTLAASAGQKVIWATLEHFSNIQLPIYNMIFSAFQKFDLLVSELSKEAMDPDFFTNGVDGP